MIYFVEADKSEKKVNSLDDKLPEKNGKQSEETQVIPSVDYKLPLVWIDLEMTGKYMLLMHKIDIPVDHLQWLWILFLFIYFFLVPFINLIVVHQPGSDVCVCFLL